MMRRVALDFEFYEDGRTITPISLGMVDVDMEIGRYWEFPFDWDQVPEGHFLWEGVKPLLTGGIFPVELIKAEILQFCTQEPMFYGWCCGYDFVTLTQLWGSFDEQVELKEAKWPFYMVDLASLFPALPRHDENNIHNALTDAIDIAKLAKKLL